MEQESLSVRHNQLMQIIQKSFEDSELHSNAFAFRILHPEYSHEIAIQSDICSASAAYGGYPHVAALGFLLGCKHILSSQHESYFFEGVKRLRNRSEKGLQQLFTDDVALLGIADGLFSIAKKKKEDYEVQRAMKWLLELIDKPINMRLWSSRMRDLAADLLDSRGRLRVTLNTSDTDAHALDITLRSTWSEQFAQSAIRSREEQRQLLKELLLTLPPQINEIERATVWFKALNTLADYTCEVLFPSVSDVAIILRDTQHSFKRWVWDHKSTRQNASPAKWLIDRESHIQSFLWAVLYPIYRSELVDETYLPSWGNVQPRFDLGIIKLKLIIEVKYARQPSDFKGIEEEVAGDLGLYFKNTDMFDSMIAYIYDDCDKHHPEKYDGLRNALMKRERIKDVIIVRRPGMIPNRDLRKFSNYDTNCEN